MKTEDEIKDVIDDLRESEDEHIQAAVDALYWVLGVTNDSLMAFVLNNVVARKRS